MPDISVIDARGLYTQKAAAVLVERPMPTDFARSWFRVQTSLTKLLNVEVQRGTEKIAVDVFRGDRGNRNTFNKNTQRQYLPPYFREYFELTELDLYDQMIASNGTVNEDLAARFINSIADKLELLRNKIERRKELMCMQALLDGIVEMVNGDNIDFLRKSESKVDIGSGDYWTVSGSDPFTNMAYAGNFLRTDGLYDGGIINAIFGNDAFAAFMKNAEVRARADIRNFGLDNMTAPQKNTTGSTYHGETSAEGYRVRLWTYNQYYETSNGTKVPYMDKTKVIYLPDSPDFVLDHGAVPQVIRGSVANQQGEYLIGEKLDEFDAMHTVDIKSAPLPILVKVNQVVTQKVVADSAES